MFNSRPTCRTSIDLPLDEKARLRAMTNEPLMRDKSVVKLSVTPSTKYSCTTIERRRGESGPDLVRFTVTASWLSMRQTAGLSALFNLLNSCLRNARHCCGLGASGS